MSFFERSVEVSYETVFTRGNRLEPFFSAGISMSHGCNKPYAPYNQPNAQPTAQMSPKGQCFFRKANNCQHCHPSQVHNTQHEQEHHQHPKTPKTALSEEHEADTTNPLAAGVMP
jgi:hypothetical protein